MTTENVIYLDNAATSFPKPPSVYETMDRFLRMLGANPGRAGHRMAVGAEQEIDRVRHGLARTFHAGDHHRIVFTLNCTDALNMGIKGVLREGDHVVTTVLEHNSVSRPLQQMAENGYITLTRLDCSGDGYLDPDAVKQALTPKTKLVVVTHASNVLGTVQPIRAIGAIAREAGVTFMVDAAQTAGALPIDVEADFIDLLAFAGHKSLYGPPGSGGLYVRETVALKPWREGGTGGDSSTAVQPTEFPHYLEGGTPNTVGIAGLGAGVAFIAETGIETIHAHEQKLRNQLRDAVADDDRFKVHGPLNDGKTVAPIALTLKGMQPEDVGSILDQSFHIAVRSGLHCAPYTHRRMETHPGGMLRFSPGFFNTEEDISATIEALREIADAGQ
jgi:cysteine desulfurase family protein